MRRPFTICASMLLMVALAPAALFAQDPGGAAAAAAPKPPAEAPKLSFTAPAGLLLIQIKPDQTAVFEELLTKLRAGIAKATDAALKEQFGELQGLQGDRADAARTPRMWCSLDPVPAPRAEYELFQVLQTVMTPDELRAPETAGDVQEIRRRLRRAGYNKLNLTPRQVGAESTPMSSHRVSGPDPVVVLISRLRTSDSPPRRSAAASHGAECPAA